MKSRALVLNATLIALLAWSPGANASTVIDFQSGVLTSTADASTYVQDGYKVASSTEYIAETLFPSLESWSLANSASAAATFFDKAFHIDAGGLPFRLQSFDMAETTFDFSLGCADGPGFGSGVGIAGWLGGALVLNQTVQSACPAGSFFSHSINSGAVDHLRFFVSGLTGIEIDNIALSPIPEPSTYALMLAGLGVIGFAARRRRH